MQRCKRKKYNFVNKTLWKQKQYAAQSPHQSTKMRGAAVQAARATQESAAASCSCLLDRRALLSLCSERFLFTNHIDRLMMFRPPDQSHLEHRSCQQNESASTTFSGLAGRITHALNGSPLQLAWHPSLSLCRV
jgi:hypothetical protein